MPTPGCRCRSRSRRASLDGHFLPWSSHLAASFHLTMSYSVKEIYLTLQGEGANTGRSAVFCRFAGCNLWRGREEARSSAICQFCDTDFVGTDGLGGGHFASARELAAAVARHWPASKSPRSRPLVVCTGGEPLLQMDEA